MPRVSNRLAANTAVSRALRREPLQMEPIGPALARGVIFLLSLATPLILTLLSR